MFVQGQRPLSAFANQDINAISHPEGAAHLFDADGSVVVIVLYGLQRIIELVKAHELDHTEALAGTDPALAVAAMDKGVDGY